MSAPRPAGSCEPLLAVSGQSARRKIHAEISDPGRRHSVACFRRACERDHERRPTQDGILTSAWPYVDVDGAPSHRCSASLLTPTVVLTAGHCTIGTSAARIWFDEVVQGNPEYPFSGATSYDGTTFTHPQFCNPCSNGLPGFAKYDVGIIVLSEPVRRQSSTPMPTSPPRASSIRSMTRLPSTSSATA